MKSSGFVWNARNNQVVVLLEPWASEGGALASPEF